MAAKTTRGRLRGRPVKNSGHNPVVAEANTGANGVFAPALSFTEDWHKPLLVAGGNDLAAVIGIPELLAGRLRSLAAPGVGLVVAVGMGAVWAPGRHPPS